VSAPCVDVLSGRLERPASPPPLTRIVHQWGARRRSADPSVYRPRFSSPMTGQFCYTAAMKTRCWWPGTDPVYIDYHDQEWGVPVHDDRTWFEFLCLDGQQAGLSWITVLKKRDNYRRAFHNFDPLKVSRMTDSTIEKLLQDPGLIRNRLKLTSIPLNGQAFLQVQEEFGSFDAYIWRFVDGIPLDGRRRDRSEVPATTSHSDAMSKDLKKRGFKFCGSTICYAFMQAAGMVNDHLEDCFRYQEIKNLHP
jgi:DNA-3-methyladenine glycosylase I